MYIFSICKAPLTYNINRNINGEFWNAENSAKKGKAVKLDAQGNFLDVLDGLNPVSHVEQHYRNLWIRYTWLIIL